MREKIKLLTALSDETRINILRVLMNGEQCACFIYPLVNKAQSTVSSHLKILVDAGILDYKKEGINIKYKIVSKDASKILSLLEIKPIKIGVLVRCN